MLMDGLGLGSDWLGGGDSGWKVYMVWLLDLSLECRAQGPERGWARVSQQVAPGPR